MPIFGGGRRNEAVNSFEGVLKEFQCSKLVGEFGKSTLIDVVLGEGRGCLDLIKLSAVFPM